MSADRLEEIKAFAAEHAEQRDCYYPPAPKSLEYIAWLVGELEAALRVVGAAQSFCCCDPDVKPVLSEYDARKRGG